MAQVHGARASLLGHMMAMTAQAQQNSNQNARLFPPMVRADDRIGNCIHNLTFLPGPLTQKALDRIVYFSTHRREQTDDRSLFSP